MQGKFTHQGWFLILLGSLNQTAADRLVLDTVEVVSRGDAFPGITQSASQGFVGRSQFQLRPLQRIGELVEVVPGMIATQHSGAGKANQYFLRGFNLDHGTDFAAFLDGVPLNLPSHGHGQGYLDLNPLIPELIDYIEYGKGPYYADVGDFASAGYARFHSASQLEAGFLRQTFGQDGYYRTVAADSVDLGQGTMLAGGELAFYDGPWDTPMDMQRYKGLVKYSWDGIGRGFNVSANAYYNHWTATNQIPERAVKRELISRLGSLDPSDGGEVHRFGLTFNGWNDSTLGQTRLTLYGYYSDLRLYSNFTFFLDDPIHGDQIFQKDRRFVVGGNLDHHWHWSAGKINAGFRLGAQIRHDFIPKVALYHTQKRNIVALATVDQINQTSLGVYLENVTRWHPKVRTLAALRGDIFFFAVKDSLRDLHSGDASDALVNPKFGLILGPWHDSELYFNYGFGFHSNDARGVVMGADPLVRSRGFEVGFRTYWLPGLSTTLALWQLKLDSELVFVGDAGTTEPSGKSKRYGVELSNRYRPFDWLTLDFDLALTRARFEDVGNDADQIPNSVGRVISGGVTIDHPSGGYAAIRIRHFGAVPLNEAGTVEAGSTTLVNLGLGWRWRDRLQLSLDLLNLTGSKDFDIAYFYASRLPGEAPSGVEDVHFHPVQPRQFRGTVQLFF